MAKRNALSSPTCRWVIDPSAPTESRIEPAIRWMTNGEFSRLDERFLAKPYTHFWQAKVDPKREYDIAKCGPPVGGLFNCLSHCTWEAGEGESAVGLGVGKAGIEEVVWAGPRATFQEPTFIPKRRSADGQGEPKEGEGYLIALVNRLDELRNDVAIFDALNLSKGPLALIHLPVKLKLGLHGNWVDRRDMEDWEERIRQQGGVKVATEPLPWQVKEREEREAAGVNGHGQNGTNGTNGTHATT